MNDTPPEIAGMVRARLMAKSGAERFRMGVEMFEAARRMVLASFPADLSDAERKRRLFERLYGMQLPADTAVCFAANTCRITATAASLPNTSTPNGAASS